MALVSAMHITSGVYVNDWEDGLIDDFQVWLEKLAPAGLPYQHHQTGEDNADAHLKRTIMGHQVMVPITAGKLDLGPWEQIFYAEFDGQRKQAGHREGAWASSERAIARITGASHVTGRAVSGAARGRRRRRGICHARRGAAPWRRPTGRARRGARSSGGSSRWRGSGACPAATLEVGETLEAGDRARGAEETGLVVEVGPVIEVFDRIMLDDDRRVQYHFVLIDYLCRLDRRPARARDRMPRQWSIADPSASSRRSI